MLGFTVAGIAQTVVATAATLGALGVISRFRPVRWVMRTLVGDPLSQWFRHEVGSIVDERLDARPLTNGWGAQAVQAIAEATGANVEKPKPQHDDG